MQGEAWPVGIVDAAHMELMRARTTQLYGFCILMATEGMSEEPVAFRKMVGTMSSGKGRVMGVSARTLPHAYPTCI